MGSEPPYGYSQQSQPWPEQPPSSYPPSYETETAYPPPPAYPSQPVYPPPGPFGAAVPPPAYPSQPAYGQPYPQPYAVPVPYAMPDPGSGMAVASLVLGIVSLVFTALFFCGGIFIAPITGTIGLILGILGRKSVTRHGSAIAGLVMSIVALAITGGLIALDIIFNRAQRLNAAHPVKSRTSAGARLEKVYAGNRRNNPVCGRGRPQVAPTRRKARRSQVASSIVLLPLPRTRGRGLGVRGLGPYLA